MRKYKISVIGLGKQSVEDHIPSILESDLCELISLCDTDQNKVTQIAQEFKVEGFRDIEELIKYDKPDIAVIAIPHSDYFDVIKKLASAKIHILKEKPFSISINEALKIHELVSQNNVHLQISVQRRYHPIYVAFFQLIKRIGRVYSIEARYVMNIKNLDSGWRSKKFLAGGGALIDMGYHFVDLIIWYFGMPDEIFARTALGNKEGQFYDVEDLASINFIYNREDQTNVIGNFLVSRVYPIKEESITVIGTKGSIQIDRGVIRRLDNQGGVQEELMRLDKWSSAFVEQLDSFIQFIDNPKDESSPYVKHFEHIAVIEAAYISAKSHQNTFPKRLISKINEKISNR